MQQKTYLWDDNDIKVLRLTGSPLIYGGSLSRSRITTALANTTLIDKFSIAQIRTRINYERHRK